MAHLRPLDNDEIEDDFIRERFQHYANTRGFTPNSIRTMARRPNVVKAFMALNQAVLYEGTVDEELKMLISLMTSFATGCLYCQSHMANLSSIYMAPDEKINDLMAFETSEHFTEPEKAALDVAYKAAQIPNAVTDKEFKRLKKHFDDEQIVEITNDTMATTLEPHALKRAAQIMGDTGWSAGKHSG